MKLITGTPGWMGTRLAEALLRNGESVRCVVLPGLDAAALKSLGADVAAADVTRPDTLPAALAGVDTVYHCAGMIHPRRPREFFEINTEGTMNLASAAARAGVRRFVYVSTNAATWADHGRVVATEENPIRPLFQYGESKLRAERRLHELGRSAGLETVVLRPNWLYGANGAGRQSRFLRMVNRGWAPYFGSPENRHSFLDIDNCVEALLLAGTAPRAAGQTYFVADDTPLGLVEIYGILARCLGKTLRPRRIPIPAQARGVYPLFNLAFQKVRFYRPEFHIVWEWSKNLVCSTAKIRDELGYRPANTFAASMEREIARLRRNGELSA